MNYIHYIWQYQWNTSNDLYSIATMHMVYINIHLWHFDRWLGVSETLKLILISSVRPKKVFGMIEAATWGDQETWGIFPLSPGWSQLMSRWLLRGWSNQQELVVLVRAFLVDGVGWKTRFMSIRMEQIFLWKIECQQHMNKLWRIDYGVVW